MISYKCTIVFIVYKLLCNSLSIESHCYWERSYHMLCEDKIPASGQRETKLRFYTKEKAA